MNKNVKIDVAVVNPKGQTWIMKNTRYDSIREVNGKLFYFYNKHQPLWEVLEIKEIPQNEVDAQDAYFKKYGTACE